VRFYVSQQGFRCFDVAAAAKSFDLSAESRQLFGNGIGAARFQRMCCAQQGVGVASGTGSWQLREVCPRVADICGDHLLHQEFAVRVRAPANRVGRARVDHLDVSSRSFRWR